MHSCGPSLRHPRVDRSLPDSSSKHVNLLGCGVSPECIVRRGNGRGGRQLVSPAVAEGSVGQIGADADLCGQATRGQQGVQRFQREQDVLRGVVHGHLLEEG